MQKRGIETALITPALELRYVVPLIKDALRILLSCFTCSGASDLPRCLVTYGPDAELPG